jgi:hypothetical protein
MLYNPVESVVALPEPFPEADTKAPETGEEVCAKASKPTVLLTISAIKIDMTRKFAENLLTALEFPLNIVRLV